VNRLIHAFSELRRSGRVPVIPYCTAGYPTLDSTADLLRALDREGVPLAEVGIPFSDPVADGPVVQEAHTTALRNGVTAASVLGLLDDLCPRISTAVVVMTYANPVWAFGSDRFLRGLAAAGVAGLLPVDIPPEEYRRFFPGYRRSPVGLAALLSPDSTPERVVVAAAAATGMLYLTSRLGTTGTRAGLPEGLTGRLDRLRGETRLPVVAGFGFSDQGTIAAVSSHADGIVVGSALIGAQRGLAGRESVDAFLAAFRAVSPA
jgi:tryptophan synthase alpha chain